MITRKTIVLGALATVAVGALVTGAAATAPLFATTGRANHAATRTAKTAKPANTPALSSLNLLDSDIELYAYEGTTWESLAAEGRMHLALHSGKYSGSFTDNTAGGKSYPVTAKNLSSSTYAGDYTIGTAQGTFTVHIDDGGNQSGTVPSKFGKNAQFSEIYRNVHAYTVATPLTVSIGRFQSGAYHHAIVGKLALTTDAWSYIVPYSSGHHVSTTFTYAVGGHLFTYKLTGSGYYYPLDANGDGQITTTLVADGTTYLVSDARQPAGGVPISTDIAAIRSGVISQSRFTAQ